MTKLLPRITLGFVYKLHFQIFEPFFKPHLFLSSILETGLLLHVFLPFRHPHVALEKSGKIIYATRCTCKVKHGGRCCHVAATLFLLDEVALGKNYFNIGYEGLVPMWSYKLVNTLKANETTLVLKKFILFSVMSYFFENIRKNFLCIFLDHTGKNNHFHS